MIFLMHIWAHLYLGLCCKFQNQYSNSNIKPVLPPLQTVTFLPSNSYSKSLLQTLLVSRGKMSHCPFHEQWVSANFHYLVNIPPPPYELYIFSRAGLSLMSSEISWNPQTARSLLGPSSHSVLLCMPTLFNIYLLIFCLLTWLEVPKGTSM